VVTIRQASTAEDLAEARRLFEEYAASLGVNLDFQRFGQELADLPGGYGPPGGCLLLCLVDGEAAGCVGVRPLEGTTCELKRLYVRPAARGLALGRALAEEAIARATALGYERMRLDTLPSMDRARALYQALGFKSIPPYRNDPIPGMLYLERDLTRPPSPPTSPTSPTSPTDINR
jgi:putative acetyltransferase